MIDHVSLPVRDLQIASMFYEPVLSQIGYSRLMVKEGTIGFGKKYADFWLNHRPMLSAAGMNDGFHVCLRALSKEQVEAFFRTALSLGGRSDGIPGFREHYHERYFAAFIFDLDGNRIEVVNFISEQQSDYFSLDQH